MKIPFIKLKEDGQDVMLMPQSIFAIQAYGESGVVIHLAGLDGSSLDAQAGNAIEDVLKQIQEVSNDTMKFMKLSANSHDLFISPFAIRTFSNNGIQTSHGDEFAVKESMDEIASKIGEYLEGGQQKGNVIVNH